MTHNEAERIYKANNCSLFVMAREDFDNYVIYKGLSINKQQEQQWRIETMEEQCAILRKTGEYCIFNQLCELAEDFHDAKNFKLMMKALEYVRIENIELGLCVAETILGRKKISFRSGLIFWAYDVGANEQVIVLIQKVRNLLSIKTDNSEIIERVERDMKKLKEIEESLSGSYISIQ